MKRIISIIILTAISGQLLAITNPFTWVKERYRAWSALADQRKADDYLREMDNLYPIVKTTQNSLDSFFQSVQGKYFNWSPQEQADFSRFMDQLVNAKSKVLERMSQLDDIEYNLTADQKARLRNWQNRIPATDRYENNW